MRQQGAVDPRHSGSVDPDAAAQLIPFNRPFMTGRELMYIQQAYERGHLSGDGPFTEACSDWLEHQTGAQRALLTHSCTAALEAAAMLLDLAPGDEVIMPSYTFVSTANAFALRGAVPVFVDIRPDTLNLDESLVEDAITPRTKAICVVHYAGIAAELDALLDIADRHGLAVIEDAAQGIMASYRGRPLGTIGDLGALSFHETKNIVSGEGGALLCRDLQYVSRAEIIREKGTNRSQFNRGFIDKYTWVDQGSSLLPGEITAAFLLAQMEQAQSITDRRLAIWNRYFDWAEALEEKGWVRRPVVPDHVTHNAHMFYLLLPNGRARDAFITGMKDRGVMAVFHYIPLHSSTAGGRFGRPHGSMQVTDRVSQTLVRLPIWLGVEAFLEQIMSTAEDVLASVMESSAGD